MKHLAITLALALSACASATAQPAPEQGPVTWNSEQLGKIVYTSEDGPLGVLTYETAFGDNLAYLYLDGLAGEFGGVGPLKGYWSESDVSHDDEAGDTLICPFAIIDNHGRTTRNWGRIVVAFTSDWFPSDFVLMRARCFEEPNEVIVGKLAK